MPDPSRLRRVAGPLASFALGQGLSQALALIAALLVIRGLRTDEYAFYIFAFAFQSVVALIVDSGVNNSIVALVGRDIADKQVIGLRLYSAMALRRDMLLPSLILIVPMFLVLGSRLGASTATVVAALATVELTLIAQQWMLYAAVFRISGRISRFYLSLNAGAVARLLMIVALVTTGNLTTFTALLSGVLSTALTAIDLRRVCASEVVRPSPLPPHAKRDVRRYLSPLLPGIVFTAFQGQIGVVVGGLFGASTNVAQVGALGRLAQVMTFVSTANGLLLEPHFARSRRSRAWRLLAVAALVTMLGAGVLLALIGVVPALTRVILGDQYSGLSSELSILVVAVAIAAVGQQIFTFNSARRYIYWWYSWAVIVTTLAAQVLSIALFGISSTTGLVLLTLVGGTATCAVHVAAMATGFVRGPRAFGTGAQSG